MINREEDISNFFDLKKDCPKNILNCLELREDYNKRYERLKKFKTCDACSHNSLKIFIINKMRFYD